MGATDPALDALARPAYDHYVLCASDFSFVQDGTRADEAFRARQHAWYVEQLAQRHIPYMLATGSPETRVATVSLAIQTPGRW